MARLWRRSGLLIAVDSRNGRPHRLVWGLDHRGTLVTIARPQIAMAPEEAGTILIRIDQQLFRKLTKRRTKPPNLPLLQARKGRVIRTR